jgi:hypothetical protein
MPEYLVDSDIQEIGGFVEFWLTAFGAMDFSDFKDDGLCFHSITFSMFQAMESIAMVITMMAKRLTRSFMLVWYMVNLLG